MHTIHGSLPSKDQLPIRYSYFPQAVEKPLLIFVHGFKGFKDWGAFPLACQRLQQSGFALLAINLSRNGTDEQLTEFNRLDLFAEQTLSGDLEDLLQVIAYVNAHKEAFPGAKVHQIGLIGHSRGGHTVIPAAVEAQEVKAVVTWSAVANYNERWTKNMLEDWKTKGYTEIKNARTGQRMQVNSVVYKDAITHADRLMADQRIKELKKPILLIHGSADDAVLERNCHQLYEACASESKEKLIISSAGHTYNVSHPFDAALKLPIEFDRLLQSTARFFLQHFH